MGFLRRQWDLACDNLLSAEVVTADGQVVTASATEHPDLYWAIRGGGGNFGVVTSFEFQLYPLGPEIFGAVVIYPFEQAAEVVRRWRDFVLQAPDSVTCDALVWGMPPLPGVPEEMHWAPVVIIAALHAGSAEEGEGALQPVRQFGAPIADMSGPQPYVAFQSSMDPLFANGQLYYWKSLNTVTLTDDAIEQTIALAAGRPSPMTLFALRGLGGAMGRVPQDATAYGDRAAMFNLSIDNTWLDPAQSSEMVAWTRAAWQQMRAMTDGGVYLNFAGLGEENDALARAAYGPNYERLARIKRRYDPDNLFRGNINIAP
jgi:FAD/FMN-containing dehydrogenase